IPPGNIVDTGALGPCVGVIIYDTSKKEAYAGHFVDCEIQGLDKMIKEAVSNFNQVDKLEFYAAGNFINTEDKEQCDYELQDRVFVKNMLNEYNFLEQNTYISWGSKIFNPDLNIWANLIFNVDTAENILEVNLHNNLTDIIKTIYTGDIRRAPKNFSI
ncbi:hypothetical protein J4437_04925, partial [Candidatus Woesearchaeota archaeon]|nr:hypothetical protein [Candidatus Woesearchaeota archaeon]